MKHKLLLLFVGVSLCFSSCKDKLASVVNCLKEFDNLELGTVEYEVTKVLYGDGGINVDNKDSGFGKRKILISTSAVLKAGFNLTDFNPYDAITVNKSDNSVSVTLPQPVLLSIDMGDEHTVYSATSWYRHNFTEEEILNLKQQNEQKIVEAVPEIGILADAKKNAKDFFEPVLKNLGFENVEVKFAETEMQAENEKTKE